MDKFIEIPEFDNVNIFNVSKIQNFYTKEDGYKYMICIRLYSGFESVFCYESKEKRELALNIIRKALGVKILPKVSSSLFNKSI